MTPTKVHLVGSIALDSVDEVFRTAGRTLGRRIRRIPDGEPGGRRLWISWQYPLLRSLAFLKADTHQPNQTSGFLPLGLAEGADPATIRFPELCYAREARASYTDFTAARSRGDVAPGTRFQVSLPTPFAVINPFILARDFLAVEPAYERAMLDEVAAICTAIPHLELCIQWDICIEMVLWDGRLPFMSNPFADLRGEVMSRIKRLAGAEATRARIRAAANYRSDFGIATECGMARCRTPELIRKLLAIHAEVASEPPPGAVHSG